MKKLSFLTTLVLGIVITLSSCGHVDPVKFNDNLVEYSNKADKRIEQFHNKINATDDLANYSDSIKAWGSVAIDSLNSDLTKIKALKMPKDGADFENATIAYVESLSAYAKTVTDEYSKITENTTEKEYDNMDKVIEDSEKNCDTKLAEMQRVQKSYASANNMSLR